MNFSSSKVWKQDERLKGFNFEISVGNLQLRGDLLSLLKLKRQIRIIKKTQHNRVKTIRKDKVPLWLTFHTSSNYAQYFKTFCFFLFFSCAQFLLKLFLLIYLSCWYFGQFFPIFRSLTKNYLLNLIIHFINFFLEMMLTRETP